MGRPARRCICGETDVPSAKRSVRLLRISAGDHGGNASSGPWRSATLSGMASGEFFAQYAVLALSIAHSPVRRRRIIVQRYYAPPVAACLRVMVV
ncbi:hypothetical protein KCP70_09070 [Salmonella enterica subsp. enterica]|nr:hypothetical protein KCP70_09070 [Salmonella enterica subsp. enterica]